MWMYNTWPGSVKGFWYHTLVHHSGQRDRWKPSGLLFPEHLAGECPWWGAGWNSTSLLLLAPSWKWCGPEPGAGGGVLQRSLAGEGVRGMRLSALAQMSLLIPCSKSHLHIVLSYDTLPCAFTPTKEAFPQWFLKSEHSESRREETES